ncbi:MAG: ADP-ribosylglycohydrolase family protein [Spirochaetia bacterium]|nr:ADP-ribosylglycohydrolase family protein [Spirochaetia bacterium]
MIGAIAGDIIGSIYEFNNIKTKDFPLFLEKSRFTDDTVLTVAVADAILNNVSFAQKIKEYVGKYPNAGYGHQFNKWALSTNEKPYNSWGNGSAMRVSSVGFLFHDLETVLQKAKESAAVTHNHPEGIKGAQAVAACIFLAKEGLRKLEIKSYIETNFNYNLSESLDEIRKVYTFDVSCQGSVPQAIISFLESTDYEDAIRNAVSIGGDSDTIACITGGIAQTFYKKIPKVIIEETRKRLPQEFLKVINEFGGSGL